MSDAPYTKRYIANTLNDLYDDNDQYMRRLQMQIANPSRTISQGMIERIKEIPILLEYLEEKLDHIVYDKEISGEVKKVYTVEVEATVMHSIDVLAYDPDEAMKAATCDTEKKIKDALSWVGPKVVTSALAMGSKPKYISGFQIDALREA